MIKSQGGNYKEHNRVSLGGVADVKLEQFLKDNSNVKIIVSCLDNDEAGNRATLQIKEKYISKGYIVKRILPKNKDFNDDLIALHDKAEDEKKTMLEVDKGIKVKKFDYMSAESKYKRVMER